jgi:hypothetical protein
VVGTADLDYLACRDHHLVQDQPLVHDVDPLQKLSVMIRVNHVILDNLRFTHP